MSTIRYFTGSRPISKGGVAGEIMRIEIQKKGKLPAAERYKRIMKKKLEESREKAKAERAANGGTFGREKRVLSKAAEQALKEVAMKKAAKEAKALRKMVIVQPRVYPTGRLMRNGKIYDVADNVVAQVDKKTGKISTMLGWSLGKYKPKSMMVDLAIQEAINKHSPYFIQQRKLQALRDTGVVDYTSHGPMTQDVINVYGNASAGDEARGPVTGFSGPRQNIGVTAWGARSDNVWGTYTDNAWGNSMDNVWGTNSTDVWGGIGVGGLWGVKGYHIWGTGNGVNYLRGLTSRVLGFFGISLKANREKLATYRTAKSAPAARSSRT